METGRANKSVSAWGARRAIAAWKPKPKAKQFTIKIDTEDQKKDKDLNIMKRLETKSIRDPFPWKQVT